MFCLFLRPTPCHVHRRSPPRSIKLHGLEAKIAFGHALALPAPGAAVAWVKAVFIDDADDDDDNDDNDDDDDDEDDDGVWQMASVASVTRVHSDSQVARLRNASEVQQAEQRRHQARCAL